MLGIYNYTVILTYIGMLTGFGGILRAIGGDPHAALVFLMVAGVCDMFDGAIASTMERTDREKRFGVQIDSLSDLVCFGVLPAVIVYTVAGQSKTSMYLCGLYLLCALIRLAWFNVDEEERQEHEGGSRTVYLGLPVTTAALILPNDPTHYYRGVMSIGAASGYNTGRIPVSMSAYPYKLKLADTVVAVTVSGTATAVLQNERRPVAPKISTTAEITVSWGSSSVSLSAGEDWTVPGLILGPGDTEITIAGNADVSIRYQEGSL